MIKKILYIFTMMLLLITFGCSNKEKSNSGKTQQTEEFSKLQSEKETKEKEAKKLKEEIKRLKAQKDSLNSQLDSVNN